MSSNISSTTDKQNRPTLLKILSHFTAFGTLSSTLQNHCYYQHKLTCCPLWLDQTRRRNEVCQRPAECTKSTGVWHTLISIWDMPWMGKWHRQGILCILLWRFVAAGPPWQHCGCLHCVAARCILQAHTLRFPASSHQIPGSAPHINQRLPPPCWALPFLPALSLLGSPASLMFSAKQWGSTGALWVVTQCWPAVCAPFRVEAGWWGFSPQRWHNSHGKTKYTAINSCCGQLECSRKHLRACFCCCFHWGKPGVGPEK